MSKSTAWLAARLCSDKDAQVVNMTPSRTPFFAHYSTPFTIVWLHTTMFSSGHVHSRSFWTSHRLKNVTSFASVTLCSLSTSLLFCCDGSPLSCLARCDVSYFRKLSWPNCAVLELQWRRGQNRAEGYRWVIPEPSPFIEAADAATTMKQSKDDTRYTVWTFVLFLMDLFRLLATVNPGGNVSICGLTLIFR